MVGVPQYASVESFEGIKAHCVDIKALAYSLVELAGKELPWRNCSTLEEIYQEKKKKDFAPHLSEEFDLFFNYAINLKPTDVIDYDQMVLWLCMSSKTIQGNKRCQLFEGDECTNKKIRE